MRTVTILFLGASKRVSLLERFLDAASRHSIGVNMISCESDERFCPISGLAQVIGGPSFLSDEFVPWLSDIIGRFSIDIVIPNMDSATVALSRFAESYAGTCWPVISSCSLCEAMYDKSLSDSFFRDRGLPVPPNTPGKFPKILKPRFGFGSRNVRIVGDAAGLDAEMREREYLVQDFLSGCQETTVDLYVSRQQEVLGYVLRDRLEVSDGEVMVCRARPAREEEQRLIDAVAAIPGWQGCITLQYLAAPDGELYMVEVNPRFGGGATCAIEAGLDMASYVLLECLGRPLTRPKTLRNLIMTRARRDFFCELEEGSIR